MGGKGRTKSASDYTKVGEDEFVAMTAFTLKTLYAVIIALALTRMAEQLVPFTDMSHGLGPILRRATRNWDLVFLIASILVTLVASALSIDLHIECGYVKNYFNKIQLLADFAFIAAESACLFGLAVAFRQRESALIWYLIFIAIDLTWVLVSQIIHRLHSELWILGDIACLLLSILLMFAWRGDGPIRPWRVGTLSVVITARALIDYAACYRHYVLDPT